MDESIYGKEFQFLYGWIRTHGDARQSGADDGFQFLYGWIRTAKNIMFWRCNQKSFNSSTGGLGQRGNNHGNKKI